MRKSPLILVTGGAGFIGGELVKQLLERRYRVRVIDDLSKKDSSIPSECEFFKIDLTDKKATLRAFDGIDFCIHLAAKIGGIGYFHKYPATILSENNKMYSSVFEAAVARRVKRIIYLSSSMVFESTKKFPSKESYLLKILSPVSAYGFSKLIGEWYCHAFHEEFGLDYTIIRPFNAYGLNEKPEMEIGYAHVIPDLIKKILSGQYPVELLGDGKQTRCFTHVSDIARGIILSLENPKAKNNDFNIGSEKEIKIVNLAKLIFQLCGFNKPFKTKFISPFKHDIKRRVPSSGRARKILGWKPQKDLEKELPIIIEWIKNLQEIQYRDF